MKQIFLNNEKANPPSFLSTDISHEDQPQQPLHNNSLYFIGYSFLDMFKVLAHFSTNTLPYCMLYSPTGKVLYQSSGLYDSKKITPNSDAPYSALRSRRVTVRYGLTATEHMEYPVTQTGVSATTEKTTTATSGNFIDKQFATCLFRNHKEVAKGLDESRESGGNWVQVKHTDAEGSSRISNIPKCCV